MIKICTVFLLCFSFSTIYSQFYFERFDNLIIQECPISNENYLSIINWEFYQTEDGDIDGNKIENCFNFSNQKILSVGTAIDDSPIFLKSIEDLNAEISSDTPYTLSFDSRTSENDYCDCTFDCSLTSCFSVNLMFSAITDGDTVKYEKLISDPLISEDNVNFINCFVTDKADKTILNGVEITIAKERYSEDEEIRITSLSIFQDEAFDFENRIIPNDFKVNSAYFVSPFYFNPYLFGSTLVRHQGPGVPGPQNIFYQELTPEDSTTQQTINIILTLNENMVFQNYTGIRGAVVAGDPNQLRHRFNLINEGFTFCFPEIIEAIFSNEDQFIHKSGKLNFPSPDGCMQFRDEAKFIMTKNSFLKYGQTGIGLLAFKNKSQLLLEQNAKMIFDGEIILIPAEENNNSIVLNQDSKLVFGKSSKITSKLSSSEIQLIVYLNGGSLDVSDLDSESLQYLNIIDYKNPNVFSRFSEFEMYPNPTSNQITLTNSAIDKVRFDVIDMSGKLILTEYINGLSDKIIDLQNTEAGIYFVKSALGTQRKLVINR